MQGPSKPFLQRLYAQAGFEPYDDEEGEQWEARSKRVPSELKKSDPLLFAYLCMDARCDVSMAYTRGILIPDPVEGYVRTCAHRTPGPLARTATNTVPTMIPSRYVYTYDAEYYTLWSQFDHTTAKTITMGSKSRYMLVSGPVTWKYDDYIDLDGWYIGVYPSRDTPCVAMGRSVKAVRTGVERYVATETGTDYRREIATETRRAEKIRAMIRARFKTQIANARPGTIAYTLTPAVMMEMAAMCEPEAEPQEHEVKEAVLHREVQSEAKACVVCDKATKRIKRCAGCMAVYYCGKTCQRGHWGSHKVTCKAIQAHRAYVAVKAK